MKKEPATIYMDNYMIARLATGDNEPNRWSILVDDKSVGFCLQRKPEGIIQGFAIRPERSASRQESIVTEGIDLEAVSEVVYQATRSVEAYEAAGKEYIAALIREPKMAATLKHMGENGYPDKHIPGESVKQVIVVRRDLGMRRGKEIAQGSHASIAFLTRRLRFLSTDNGVYSAEGVFTEEEHIWMKEGFTKICLRVDSEEELLTVKERAHRSGLNVHLITDAGKTEFHGIPTNTCLAIGPHYASRIDAITGHLTLL